VSYWTSITDGRISRRRALATTGAGALGAAFLAACGGGSDKGGDDAGAKKDASSLVFEPSDSTARAKPGGTLKHFASTDMNPHFDSLANNGSGPLSMSAAYAYPRLVKYGVTKYPKEYDNSFVGDMAESWEISPDHMTITFKIRQGVKWDARPPTSGRLWDAQDVVKSWEKFTTVNPGRSSYAYDATSAPTAPILSLTAPDTKTIVVKLREPDASAIPLLAGTTFSPMPREFDGGFDARSTVRGHGPYVLEEYQPSTRFVWRKNPDYYVKDRPFIDRIEVPIVPEYATRLAQFKAGNIHTDVMGGNGGGQGDIVPTKKEHPELLLAKVPSFATQASWMLQFGYEGNSPFKDVRMRQAASMLIDREGYIDVIDNRDGFKKDGLDLEVVYNSIVSAGWTGFYLDPKDTKGFGDNAKYLTHNVTEAKKLIAAAGNPNGGEFDFHYNASAAFPVQAKVTELYNAMFIDGGLKPKLDPVTNPTQYQDDYYYGYQNPGYANGTKKGYSGAAMGQERPFATIAIMVFGLLHKDGPFYKGMSPDGKNLKDGDSKVNDLAQKIKVEFDLKKQTDLTHELIKYFTGQSYYIPQPSSAKGFGLWWPVIGNLNAWSNGVSPNVWTENRLPWWIDASKPPLGKA
jgi:ABC-type transport system substrate-binding protein